MRTIATNQNPYEVATRRTGASLGDPSIFVLLLHRPCGGTYPGPAALMDAGFPNSSATINYTEALVTH
jgi:hypothetical protein